MMSLFLAFPSYLFTLTALLESVVTVSPHCKAPFSPYIFFSNLHF